MSITTPTMSADALQRQKELVEEKKKELEIAKEILQVAQATGTATQAQQDAVRDARNLLEIQDAWLQNIINKRKEESAEIAEQYLKTQDYLNQIQAMGNTLENNILKRQVEKELLKEELEYYKDQLKIGRLLTTAEKERQEAAQKRIDQLDEEEARIARITKQLKEGIKGTDRWSQNFDKLKESVKDIIAAFKLGPKEGFTLLAMKGGAAIDSILLGGIQKMVGIVIQSLKQLIISMDEVTKAFEVATGMGDKFSAGMESSWYTLRDTGATMEDLSKSTQSLIAHTSDFSIAQVDVANRVRDTGTLLSKVGVDMDDYAKGMQNSMKIFGQSWQGAESTALELLETSKALGIPPKQLAADYATMGRSLAKLGNEGPRAFKELARVSKITGMEIQKLINLTSKFDTFEDAATMTGQLNAALGGNFVNAMDMMMTTDPVQRFEQLRDAISSTGLTFDDMSYYQRQFFTNAMGLSDVGDLALMMEGNMNLMSGATQKNAADYVELAKQAETNLNLQQRWDTLLAKMAPMLMDIVEELHVFLEELKNNETALKDIADAARSFMNFGMWVIKNMDLIIGVLSGLRIGLFLLQVQAYGTAAALSFGPLGLVAAIGMVGAAFFMRRSPSFWDMVGTLVPNALSNMGAQAKGASAELRGSGKAIRDVGRDSQSGLQGLKDTAAALSEVGSSMQGMPAANVNLLSSFTSIDIAILEKTKELFEGIAAAIKSIPERQSVALAAVLNQTVARADHLPTQKAMALTDTMDSTAKAASAMQTTAFMNVINKTSPAKTHSSRSTTGGDLGTFTIKFNNDMFKDKVFKLVNESEKIKAIEAELNEA